MKAHISIPDLDDLDFHSSTSPSCLMISLSSRLSTTAASSLCHCLQWCSLVRWSVWSVLQLLSPLVLNPPKWYVCTLQNRRQDSGYHNNSSNIFLLTSTDIFLFQLCAKAKIDWLIDWLVGWLKITLYADLNTWDNVYTYLVMWFEKMHYYGNILIKRAKQIW